MNDIESYLKKHDACKEGAAYALTQTSMKEVWDNCPKLSWLLWILIKEEKSSEKELRLFAVWCARQVQHLMKDRRSLDAIDVAERFANGNATEEELAAAENAAWAAAYASKAAAGTAERDAVDAAWHAAARRAAAGAACDTEYAASSAAWAVARGAMRADDSTAAQYASRNAKRDAAHTAQVKQFKLMIQNPFK